MGRITSNVGLVTGLPIAETVRQLMAIAARPRDLLTTRNDDLNKQQSALDALGSRLLAFQFAVNRLKSDAVYNTRTVTSNKIDALTAEAPAGGTPAVGALQVHPVRAASSQSLVSQTFESLTGDLGDGLLRFGFGGFVDQGISLDQLNNGAGVQRGKIKITDRSGTSALIDLRHARTVDDVLQAINSNADLAVTASASGDSFVLADGSGGSGNLVVQEVGGNTTAASLGLAGINVAADTASGGDVFRLHAGTKLETLNDGNGVRLSAAGVKDLDIELSDGTELQIDLAGATTLGDVVAKINAASPSKLSASIAADGNRLQLNDLTGGSGSFTVDNGAASTAADELGVAGTGVGGVVTGGRLVSGLRDSLLSRLNGGAGIGPLGEIDLTDRDGGTATVDLASAETLGDVINLINASAANVAAAFNRARNGIVLTDASGGVGNLIIASGDSTNSAEALGIDVNSAVGVSNSGALHRQTISEATLLSSLNGGKGVTLGDLRLTDAAGVSQSVDLNPVGNHARTVGDVIDRINALTNGVEARINDAGDGVLITNTATGAGAPALVDLSGNVGKSLNLTRASKTIDVGGSPTKVIDGSTSYAIDLSNLQLNSSDVALSSLNNGAGVSRGSFVITNAAGRSIAIDLKVADAGITTVGQLVDAINSKAAAGSLSLTATINDAGTGIKLTDASGGSGKLVVRDVSGTAATNLKIAGEGIVSGANQVINGGAAFSSGAAGAQSGVKALAARINDLKAGVTASTVFDGTGYRLSLSVNAAGDANQLLIDAGSSELSFDKVTQGRDALLLYGDLNSASGGVLLSSPDGAFNGSVGGLNLKVLGSTEAPVTVTVAQTDASLVDGVKQFVEAYNALRKDLAALTDFDPAALTTGLLFGTTEALQIDVRLSRALTDRHLGLGDIQSLEQIGVSVKPDGTLEVNNAKLQAVYESNPEGLQTFLADSQRGVAVKLSKTVDTLAGADKSLLAARSDAIQATIEANQNRIDRLNSRLELQEERLFLQFTQLENIIARLQQSQSALASLQVFEPLTSRSN